MSSIFQMGPEMLGSVAIGDRVFRAVSEQMQTDPTLKCNAAWDPACPRPVPEMTMVPYVPSSYLQGVTFVGGVSKARPRDRSGRRV